MSKTLPEDGIVLILCAISALLIGMPQLVPDYRKYVLLNGSVG